MLSKYAYFVYLFRAILNSDLVSQLLPNWIDNIFGKNQLPDNSEKMETSCNIFIKSSYEEKTNLEKKLDKYIRGYYNKEIDLKSLAKKILLKIDLINNYGTTPHKIIYRTVILNNSSKNNNNFNICSKIKDNNYYKFIYFIKNKEEIIILFNNKNKKDINKTKQLFFSNSNK